MYGLFSLTKELSFDSPEEDIMALDLRVKPGRNSSKQNMTRKRYMDLGGSGGLYNKKIHNKREVLDENGSERGSEAATPPPGAARGATRS